MLNVSKECKEAFMSAQHKMLVLAFDDGTVIDNDDIAMESMSLEQFLCSTDELRFGEISSAKFKTKIKVSTKRYKDLWFNASIHVGDYSIKLGRFKTYTDNMTSDKLYREIVAYDALYWAMNTDVTDWYNSLTFPITQKAFRDSLFSYLGIEQEDVVLPNDSITFNRTVNAEKITGLAVLQKLCEINATWGVVNNEGFFKYVMMRTHEHDALYPSDTLYPSDSLYPNDIYDDRLSKANYFQGTLTYEEYDTKPITKVTIREDADDLGYSYGEDGNTYIIEDNFLMYGASDLTLNTVAKNFYEYAQYIAYTPSQLKTKGAPWREVGDLLNVVADKRTLTIPILNRQMDGIIALKDTYIAKGKELYVEKVNGTTEQLKQLQSRTNKLTRTLDETKSEISRIDTKFAKKNYLLDSKQEREVTSNTSYKLSSKKTELKNTNCSFSFIGKALEDSSTLSISYRLENGTILSGREYISVESEEKVYSKQLSKTTFTGIVSIVISCSKPIVMREAKLEIGKPTEWTEADEEYITSTEVRSEIKQTAESITSTVARSENKWIIDYETYTVDLYGFGTPSNDTAGSNVGKYYLDQESGSLYTTIKNDEDRYVWTEVAQFESIQSDMYSKIEQNAYGITQRVVKGDVVSEINQSADTIELKGDRIIVESTKWKVNENGSQECSDLTITGGNIDIYTSSDSAIAVEGDIYRSQIGAVGISVFRPDWNRKTEHIANGFFVYNDEGTRVTDITGDLNGIINTDGNVDIGGYLIVGGTKSRMVNTSNYRERLLYCYETPSPMFGDLGEGTIDETGKCYIFLDDIFGETIDSDCVYQVFLQPYGKGDCYVTERTSSYFIVEGTENLSFCWELKAIQRGFDTIRMEEYELNDKEKTDVLSETYGYLTTLLYNPETEEIENE